MNSFLFFLPKSRHAAQIIAAAFLAFTLSAIAQDKPAPANSANTAAFAFDIVSIKPYKQTGDGVSMWMNTTPDGFSSRGFSLKSFLFNAFPIVMPDQLVGLPPWADSDYYEVDAKMDEETAAAYKKLPRDQGRQVWHQMMQDLLADRFQLKFHKETRELPIYNLVVAKAGLKIEATPEGKGNGYSMGGGKLSGTGIALDSLAFSLSNEVGRMIVNKTGLTGGYNIDLKWQPDAMAAGSSNSSSADPPLPDLFTALQEQLGLKLEAAKGPVDVYVIDQVEKPSEN
ncbi:MAG: TIGR03435 family protein [Terracidiphilus sp.]|jgi:uncharacterized protein (TIGR03435 family)